jgi:hypothetical protein
MCFRFYELWGNCWVAGLARGMPVIWPAPSRGEGVVLKCACRGTVLWHLPLIFVYRIRIVTRGDGCPHRAHVSGSRPFVRLETIAARADSQTSA